MDCFFSALKKNFSFVSMLDMLQKANYQKYNLLVSSLWLNGMVAEIEKSTDDITEQKDVFLFF